MIDLELMYRQNIAAAVAKGIDDDMIRAFPDSNPTRYAELMAEDAARDKEREEHRATCTCPYCGA
jgi:hypothetical protein